MQMKLVKKRYLVFREAYIIENGKEIIIRPVVSKNGKWEKIDLFEEYLVSIIDYNIKQSNRQMQIRVKENAVDLVKCFEWLMCIILAILFIVYLLDIIKRW